MAAEADAAALVAWRAVAHVRVDVVSTSCCVGCEDMLLVAGEKASTELMLPDKREAATRVLA